MKFGLYRGISNEKYHEVLPWGEAFVSSSQLKDANEDIEVFHKKYILKEIERKEIPAFAIGTYYHTAILEPELLGEECAVYEGGIRKGKVWEEFKKTNAGKAIITAKEFLQADALIQATKDSPIAMSLLAEGEAEVSLYTELEGVKVKVRADWINFEKGYVLDLKSTTGNAKDVRKVQQKISSYCYDLSAALYLDAFNNELGKAGEPLLEDWYWTFASKDFKNCRTYRASKHNLEVGRSKYKAALRLIKKYSELGWQFQDEIIELDAASWEKLEWLTEEQRKEIKEVLTGGDEDLL